MVNFFYIFPYLKMDYAVFFHEFYLHKERWQFSDIFNATLMYSPLSENELATLAERGG